MSRSNLSSLWLYFDKIKGTKTAVCRLCNETFSFYTSNSNLKKHLERKHKTAYATVDQIQKQNKVMHEQNVSTQKEDGIIFEYVVASSPTPHLSGESEKNTCDETSDTKLKKSKPSITNRRPSLVYHDTVKSKERMLIAQLTEEKISVANLQKELIEKEMQEKNIKVMLLNEELEHKRYIHKQEKAEIEHKKQMNELEKEEMLLKIELLKVNLNNAKRKQLESDVATT